MLETEPTAIDSIATPAPPEEPAVPRRAPFLPRHLSGASATAVDMTGGLPESPALSAARLAPGFLGLCRGRISMLVTTVPVKDM